MPTTELAKKRLPLPVWNIPAKKLSRHYKTEEVLNMFKLLSTMQQDFVVLNNDEHFKIPPVTLARLVSKLHRPPRPVMEWSKRLLAIFYNDMVKEAVENGNIKAVLALSDIADRLKVAEFSQLIKESCENGISHKDFRTKLKLLKRNTHE